MPRTIPFAQYAFKRLQELNCHSIHGVPGDFFLRALDHTGRNGSFHPRWIGNASELCAGYAADGYAREASRLGRDLGLSFRPAVGALFTTYGVGELSAINAVAGSYAESIPVVHMVGTPSRRAMANGDRRRPIHHSLADGNMDVWADMAKNVTCAQAYLHKQEDNIRAAEMFDDVLEKAVLRSKPVYASIPSDMIDAEIPADILRKPLQVGPPPNDAKNENILIEELLARMKAARNPLIIADGLSYPLQLRSEISSLVEMTGTKGMCYMAGKGIIEENLPSWNPALPNSTEQSRYADLVMYFGPLLADTNTARWSAIPQSQNNVYFNLDTVEMDGRTYNIRSKELLGRLVSRLGSEYKGRGELNDRKSPEDEREFNERPRSLRLDRKITQDDFWGCISAVLRPNDTILLANGTPLIGGRALRLGEQSTVIASSIWCSIGQMLPSAQGVAAAKADLGLSGRTILFEGDGSFQVTCQSISDIIRNRLDATIFLINNKGYTYERWLNGMNATYNDVPAWRYREAAKFFGGGDDAFVWKKVETCDQLLEVVQEEYANLGDGGLRIYEIMMDPEDVPDKSKAGLVKASEALRSE